MIPPTMTAVRAENGQPLLQQIPTPQPAADEVLIKVHASALNRADLLQVRGNYPPPADAPDTLGLELAGEVVQVGAAVDAVAVGQRVMALVGGGGYAEYATVPALHLMPIPPGLSFAEAAALPEVFLTAYSNMVEIGRLSVEDVLLVHAGASGVGLACLQIARVMAVPQIIATASAGKHPVCRENGASLVIDYRSENFAELILQQLPGVDLIIDFIGAAYWEDNLRVLNKWGRLVYVGLMGGSRTEVDLGQILRKCLTVSGSTLRNRTGAQKARLVAAFWGWGAAHLEAGRLRPNLYAQFPLAEVAAAHAMMQANENAGKIVLLMP